MLYIICLSLGLWGQEKAYLQIASTQTLASSLVGLTKQNDKEADENTVMLSLNSAGTASNWNIPSDASISNTHSNVAQVSNGSLTANISISSTVATLSATASTNPVNSATASTNLVNFQEDVDQTISITSDVPLVSVGLFFQHIYADGSDTTFIGAFEVELWNGTVINNTSFTTESGSNGFPLITNSTETPFSTLTKGGSEYAYDDTNFGPPDQHYGILVLDSASISTGVKRISFTVLGGPSGHCGLGLIALPVSDSDSDMIIDFFDLDDDNDGIPDINEFCLASPALVNGGFESGATGNNLTSITGWTVNSGNIDVGPYSPVEGSASVDLNGITAGSISQEVTTSTANSYQLAFYYAANTHLSRRMRVSAVDVLSGDTMHAATFTKDGQNPAAADFLFGSIDFTATGTNTRLSFHSLVSGNGGNLLDGVVLYEICDIDGDGLPNKLDLDSDNDGIPDIVEASGTDSNGDGVVDTGTDTDADGLVDTYDNDDTDGPDVSACSLSSNCDLRSSTSSLFDTNADGANDNNRDSDSDGYADFIDIDADNDGIVDNTEAQATASYIAPSGTDTDNDGIDNAYDVDCTPCGGVTGQAIVPANTDGAGNPDYTDTDSDDDGTADVIEGHDTDGSGTVDASDSPNANTGVSGGATDADGDGLLDGFDNNTASWDATNGSLTPNSHPDAQGVSSERDWREDVALPVEWLSLEVVQLESDALLKWSTASEINADIFEIERSLDGNTFQKVGVEEAVGNSQKVNQYSFKDQGIVDFSSQSLFYRLRQVDKNGTFEYSKVVELSLRKEKQSIRLKIQPNPVHDILRLTYEQTEPNNLPFTIYSSSGQKLYTAQIKEQQGELSIRVSDWPKGAYFIKVEDERNVVVRFLVIHP
ncbi:MAG: T9SS type A sorting domain-containing protein [Bacteroidota bacterium]